MFVLEVTNVTRLATLALLIGTIWEAQILILQFESLWLHVINEFLTSTTVKVPEHPR
jgi:hypothetical protein